MMSKISSRIILFTDYINSRDDIEDIINNNIIPDYIIDVIIDAIKVVIKNNSEDAIPDHIIDVIIDIT